MKKLVTEPFSKKIYWATEGTDERIMTGDRKDVTDNAINCVTNHMIAQDTYIKNRFFGYTYNLKDNTETTLCAFDTDVYKIVYKKDIEKLKEYKKMYEDLCK